VVSSSHVDDDEGDEDDGKMASSCAQVHRDGRRPHSRKSLEERERERENDGDDDVMVGD